MDFLPLLRELARSYQALESFSGSHVRSFGLTPPQFDLIASLGNQPPMTCQALSSQSPKSSSNNRTSISGDEKLK